MADIEANSVCEEGYTTVSRVGDFELTVDATGEDGPTPNEVLAADYASCYVPALRVAGQQHGYDDLGRVEVDVEANLDDDDDLTDISFDIGVEADVDDEDVDALIETGEDICHVHSALREGLHADISLESGV
ncbi:OsmC family protein [Halorarius halobius]|uniref:OsmC family protein n=1 Tax=Halorarius halobius TaxID=2962671 RepID=UPI0020CEF616|nr:OsmC family protein [Halorarius halobius]